MNHEPYGRHLPLFPTLYSRPDFPLTEERVEREIERLVDRADAAFLAGRATQKQYDMWNIALNRWARDMHQFARLTTPDLNMQLTGWTTPAPWPQTFPDDEGFACGKPRAR